METQQTSSRPARFIDGVLATVLGGGFIAAATLFVTQASAQEDLCRLDDSAYDMRRGECSVGTAAPSNGAIIAALSSGSDTLIQSTLEYGERVQCAECVVPVFEVMFTSDNAQTREFAAWWLRRRNESGWIAEILRDVVGNTLTHPLLPAGVRDEDLRARAAEALGEFLRADGVTPLANAARNDASALVRAAAVGGLCRLNHPGSEGPVAAALSDSDASVRGTALGCIQDLNFFRGESAVVAALDDERVENRRAAAHLLGLRRMGTGTAALGALLLSDSDEAVRRNAAWALGRIGSSDAKAALAAARSGEVSAGVRNAIEIAQQM